MAWKQVKSRIEQELGGEARLRMAKAKVFNVISFGGFGDFGNLELLSLEIYYFTHKRLNK